MRRYCLPIIVLCLLSLLAVGCHRAAAPASAGSAVLPGAKEVTFRAADGWVLHADYAPARGVKKAVILLHQRNGSAGDWAPLVAKLRAVGIASLAVDQRGAGRSVGRANGDNAPWNTIPDIAAAVAWLRQQGFDPKHIGLAGASYGANNALIYASAHPEVPAVVLLSPGTDYHGLRIAGPAAAYRGAVLTEWSQGDPITQNGPAVVARAMKGRHEEMSYPGDAHGTYLFRSHPDSMDVVTRFLMKNL